MLPIEFNSEDRLLVKIKERPGNSLGENHNPLVKEEAAHLAIELGSTIKAAEIMGITQPGIIGYVNGRHIDEESKIRILDHKHQIQDLAVSKLMDTLNLFNPNELEKQSDIVRAASQLSSVVDKISGKSQEKSNVQIVVYCPEPKKIESYQTIDI